MIRWPTRQPDSSVNSTGSTSGSEPGSHSAQLLAIAAQAAPVHSKLGSGTAITRFLWWAATSRCADHRVGTAVVVDVRQANSTPVGARIISTTADARRLSATRAGVQVRAT